MTQNTTKPQAVIAAGGNHFDAAAATLLDGQDGISQQDPVTRQSDLTDWDSLRVSQDFAALTGTKILTTIPVCKPHRQWFFQTHTSAEWQYPTYTLEDMENRETYLIDRPLWSALAGEIVFKTMVSAINRQGVFFFWPVRMPDPTGREDKWARSALEFAKLAMGKWVRVTSNMSLGAYEVIMAPPGLPAPEWPELEFPTLLDIAFREKIIRDFNHPVLKRLRGEL